MGDTGFEDGGERHAIGAGSSGRSWQGVGHHLSSKDIYGRWWRTGINS
jgi:glycine/D-amino acid oxidase-like deaminating enzyme